jgi:hypothetical protein
MDKDLVDHVVDEAQRVVASWWRISCSQMSISALPVRLIGDHFHEEDER